MSSGGVTVNATPRDESKVVPVLDSLAIARLPQCRTSKAFKKARWSLLGSLYMCVCVCTLSVRSRRCRNFDFVYQTRLTRAVQLISHVDLVSRARSQHCAHCGDAVSRRRDSVAWKSVDCAYRSTNCARADDAAVRFTPWSRFASRNGVAKPSDVLWSVPEAHLDRRAQASRT